jgi:DNA-nicking Smr family endonuclease
VSAKGRRPSAEEAALWRAAMKDAKPIGHGGRPAPPEPPPPPTPAAAPPVLPPASPLPLETTLDRRNAQRLKRGRINIERRLDLHGHTHAEAHAALADFVVTAVAAGLRSVLVITGKGSAARLRQETLRDLVPRWLGEPRFRRHVIAFHPAAPRHGGAGALYVMLRRERASA